MNQDLLKQLADGSAFGLLEGEGPEVEIIQTHLSVVCLVSDLVYKLRKPITLPFVDFSDPEARERDCRAELQLNRRLCPDVYLDVVELSEKDGRFRFGGDGETVDHAVLMRRLPADRMLDVLLDEDQVRVSEVEAIADRVARFHPEHRIEPGPGDAGHPRQLASFLRANFTDTEDFVPEVFDRSLHRRLAHRAEADLKWLCPELERRIGEGHCVDGHGDLHARNICLTDPPAIYDCLEFSDGMRCSDTAVENAFLIMDLHKRGHPELADAYLRRYVSVSGDADQERLLPPLIGYRAMVRAKVAAIASRDDDIDTEDRDAQRDEARVYMQLCAAVAIDGLGPVHLIACGLPASGKSFVFESLERATRWRRIATDLVRREVFSVPDGQKAPAKAYRPESIARIYSEVSKRAREHTERTGRSVLLDATFQSRAERQQAVDNARASGAFPIIVHVETDEAETIRRLEARGSESKSDARVGVYERMKESFETPSTDEPVIRVDGAADASASIDALLTGLLERLDPQGS